MNFHEFVKKYIFYTFLSILLIFSLCVAIYSSVMHNDYLEVSGEQVRDSYALKNMHMFPNLNSDLNLGEVCSKNSDCKTGNCLRFRGIDHYPNFIKSGLSKYYFEPKNIYLDDIRKGRSPGCSCITIDKKYPILNSRIHHHVFGEKEGIGCLQKNYSEQVHICHEANIDSGNYVHFIEEYSSLYLQACNDNRRSSMKSCRTRKSKFPDKNNKKELDLYKSILNVLNTKPTNHLLCSSPQALCKENDLTYSQKNGDWTRMPSKCCFEETKKPKKYSVEIKSVRGMEIKSVIGMPYWELKMNDDPLDNNKGRCYLSPELSSEQKYHYYLRFCNNIPWINKYIFTLDIGIAYFQVSLAIIWISLFVIYSNKKIARYCLLFHCLLSFLHFFGTIIFSSILPSESFGNNFYFHQNNSFQNLKFDQLPSFDKELCSNFQKKFEGYSAMTFIYLFVNLSFLVGILTRYVHARINGYEFLLEFSDLIKISKKVIKIIESEAFFAWHGTSYESAKNIEKNGFIPSLSGLLGKGVYVSTDRSKALCFAQSKTKGVLIKVKVNPGKVIKDPTSNLMSSWHENGYDTAYIPASSSTTQRTEHCIWDPKRVEFLEMEEIGDSIV